MYQALYRKYRPTVFSDVCGQEHVTSVLQYECENGRISHAYLFCGSRGTGKTTCAKILARAVNCEDPKNGNPCGECASCRSIEAGNAMDVLEMDAASNNGVEYIRDIRDAVSFTPAALKRRVYIIDEVHMLSMSAFNALLKTLEEPPEHVVFILATTEMHKLPATIVSRCQRFDFHRIPVSVIAERLSYIASRESLRLDPEAALRIARQAQGGMRDAISLFEICAGGGADVTVRRVEEILGLSGRESLRDAALALVRGDMPTILRILAEIAASSRDVAVFWQELIGFYRDMMVAKYCADPMQYLDLTPEETQLLKEAAAQISLQILTYHSAVLDGALTEMQRTPGMKRTIAEFACLRMCDPHLDDSAAALAARIDRLENTVRMLELNKAVPVSSAPAEREEVGAAAEAASAPPAAVRPTETPAAAETAWEPLADASDFIEKLAELDRQTASFLAAARILISPDGGSVKILCDSDFAVRMLSREDAGKRIADALALCGITEGTARITAERKAADAAPGDAAQELY